MALELEVNLASVIIPTRNRAGFLARCLESLTRQTLPIESFEVLVVDNGSTDHTSDVAKHYASFLQLIYVSAPDPGLHVGRHQGMWRANSDVLMFTDDDIEAEPGWVEAVAQTFVNSDVALVGGNNYPLFEEAPPAWLLRLWERPVYKGKALPRLSVLNFGEGMFEINPGYVWGCNFSIRRDVLLEAGGFHPDGVPKDQLRYRGDGETHVSDFVRKSGLLTLFNSRASVRHVVPASRMTKAYFEQRAYAQGISDSFAEIRRNGGLNKSLSTNVGRQLARLRSALGTCVRSLARAGDAVEQELLAVRRAAGQAHRRGYTFHQREVRADPTLLAWVLREHYW